MKANIVSAGNSKGIRIPKAMLKQLNIHNHVEIKVENKVIVIKPIKDKPREGWDRAFKMMHERKEDALFIDEKTDFEVEGWE